MHSDKITIPKLDTISLIFSNAQKQSLSRHSELTMKLRSPVRIVETDQAGFQVSGW